MNKAELLQVIKRDRGRLDALIGSLSETQILATELDAGWSVKDVVAHISVWEKRCAEWLDDVARGVTPARPEVGSAEVTNAANARDYAAAKGLLWETVLTQSRDTTAAIVAAIEALPDAELAGTERFGWPTWQMASSNSDEHYREHIDQIQAWLKKSA